MTESIGLAVTFYGHGTFGMTTPGGKRLIIDPWLESNPACPDDKKTPAGLDMMLVTHGHFDHIADALALAEQFKPRIVVIHEICRWLELRGAENVLGMNKGGLSVMPKGKKGC